MTKTPVPWRPASFPADAAAAAQLREWLDDTSYALYGVGHDFRGAGLSDGDFSGAWLIDAVLTGVELESASFYRADLTGADLTGANLVDADLVRAKLDRAVLRSARLDGADMVKASLHDVDASGASLRGTRIMGASLYAVDLRGADLTDAVLFQNTFKVTVDDTTLVRGLTGTAFGPVTVVSGEGTRKLTGPDIEAWIAERGGQVRVLEPHNTRRTPA
ncbi:MULTISPECIES: pentapeptide repeat-containing protein [unclassified Streptomyces]|uniref:pentapeptide repeat-containing protein n=1 Tax=unclassified Streptomyces TaxID=2593676 RepID=UPI00037AFB5F|nr:MULTISPECIES: pentapeptide repeat-containing protein [unclassified Streptomyces]MYQ76643.1 pentapeptide repeat-containing protein [Streptomyces sp. SID4923]